MAEDIINETGIPDDFESSVKEAGFKEPKPKVTTTDKVYQVIGDSKIPIAKSSGKLWLSRKDQALSKRRKDNIEAGWDEALRYYRSNQFEHRNSIINGQGNKAKNLQDGWTETENLVFSNAAVLVPLLYSQNPRVEFTSSNEEQQDYVDMMERLLNNIIKVKYAPGINLKPKMRKAILIAHLTNKAWIETGYTKKANSSEEAINNLTELATKLENAKNNKEVQQIEGDLIALEDTIDFLNPAGPWIKIKMPHDVIVDPDAVEPDYSDARWMMSKEYLSTAYINAVFGKEDKNEEFRSIYDPTHILKLEKDVDNNAEDLTGNSIFTSLTDESEASSYGYEDEMSYAKAQRSAVWKVWDKVTRRIYLFNDKDWSRPIWVWQDEYNLPKFFPFTSIEFHIDPINNEGRGEVSYYLDQQDAVNEMVSEENIARQWVKRNLFYNKNSISQKEVEKILKGPEGTAVGIDVPEGTDLNKAISSISPPSMNFPQMFDPTKKIQAISRITGINEAARGGEFKTNTTNEAVRQYSVSSNTRLDDKIDSIEEAVGEVILNIGTLIVQFMPDEQVMELLGTTSIEPWESMSAQDFRKRFSSVQIVAGTTAKPNSAIKKQEALQITQILGQFAGSSPVAMIVALQTLEKAFDDVVIKKEDWELISQSIEAQMQGQAGGKGSNPEEVIAQVAQFIDSLPPQAKAAVGQAIADGIPMEQIMAELAASTQQQ